MRERMHRRSLHLQIEIAPEKEIKMKKTVFILLAAAAGAFFPLSARDIVRDDENVYVRFQVQSGNSWSGSSAVLRGSTSESMIRNELSRRYPNRKVRILSVRSGKSQRYLVRYQVSRDRKNWSTSSAVLFDAITESMARNQISQRHPGMQVRILSKVRQ